MLRNYKKKSSLYPWCIKSLLFERQGFSTSLPLQFHEFEPLGYVSVYSKLIDLSSKGALSSSEMDKLEGLLNDMEFWKDIGVEENASKEMILEKLKEVKKNKGGKKLSEGKRLLVEVVVGHEEVTVELEESTLIALFNGILYQRVKALKKQKIRRILKE